MKKIFKHILFWVGVFLFYQITYTQNDNYSDYLKYNIVNTPLYMVAFYLLQYVQIPLLLNKKKYFLFGLSFIASSYFIGTICHLFWYYVWNDPSDLDQSPFLTLSLYLSKTIRYYTPSAAIIAYKSQKKQVEEKERLQKLQQEKVETELKYLKSQLNPHFLFNTLNNLYSFIINNSPKAGDMVLRLSEILDYTLYKSQAKYVPLSNEVKLIENYIELEKIRYGERLSVSFTKINSTFNSKIAPLLLLSIVENAFKHGASGNIDKPKIEISIKEEGNIVEFSVWNTKPLVKSESLNDKYKEGIGLKNIIRQLNLLYPSQYVLSTENNENFFNFKLTINTSKNEL